MSHAARNIPATTRRQRRAAELTERRDNRRRTHQPAHSRSPLLWMSLGAIALGVLVIGAIALLRNDAPSTEGVYGPTIRTDYALADGMALGQASAPLTIEVWSDYQCPFCNRFATTWENDLAKQYVVPGKVRIVYRDFAFIGAESVDAAVAGRCAANQGQYWPFHDYLFANQNGENKGWFSSSRLQGIGQSLGLDMTTFNTCRADPAVAQQVREETQAGRAAGVVGTPTLAIGGTLRADLKTWDSLVSAVEAALAKVAP